MTVLNDSPKLREDIFNKIVKLLDLFSERGSPEAFTIFNLSPKSDVEEIKTLLKFLNHKSEYVRNQAIEKIGLACSSGYYWWNRIVPLELREICDGVVTSKFKELTKDPYKEVRRSAQWALLRLSEPPTLISHTLKTISNGEYELTAEVDSEYEVTDIQFQIVAPAPKVSSIEPPFTKSMTKVTRSKENPNRWNVTTVFNLFEPAPTSIYEVWHINACSGPKRNNDLGGRSKPFIFVGKTMPIAPEVLDVSGKISADDNHELKFEALIRSPTEPSQVELLFTSLNIATGAEITKVEPVETDRPGLWRVHFVTGWTQALDLVRKNQMLKRDTEIACYIRNKAGVQSEHFHKSIKFHEILNDGPDPLLSNVEVTPPKLPLDGGEVTVRFTVKDADAGVFGGFELSAEKGSEIIEEKINPELGSDGKPTGKFTLSYLLSPVDHTPQDFVFRNFWVRNSTGRTSRFKPKKGAIVVETVEQKSSRPPMSSDQPKKLESARGIK